MDARADADAVTSARNPLALLGAIGDQRTLALVRDDGTIPYLCWPELDSPTVFSALLSGTEVASTGLFARPALAPLGQAYLPDTNLLVTRLGHAGGEIAVTDTMAIAGPQTLLRRIACTRGHLALRFAATPMPDYERAPTAPRATAAQTVVASGGAQPLALTASFALSVAGAAILGGCDLSAGETAWIAFHHPGAGPDPRGFDPEAMLAEAAAFWRDFGRGCGYGGPHAAQVRRSLLATGLLHNRAHGGVAAAGTFGLPEAAGGERNWDYRYAWVRDSALGARAMALAGEGALAESWLARVLTGNRAAARSPLRLMLRLDGGEAPEAAALDGFAGLLDARPVSVGNQAGSQLQLDIFGEIALALRTLLERGHRSDPALVVALRACVDWLVQNWQGDDASIWELPGTEKPYLVSRLMCWVAFRDMGAICAHLDLPPDPAWAAAAEAVAADITANFWCPKLECYTQTSAHDWPDAATLYLRLSGFLPADDPRWRATKARIRRDLVRPAGVLRYPHHAEDGFASDEGTFVLCTCWWCLALHMDGETIESRATLTALIGRFGATGLMTEEVAEDGTLLGNLPQLFSHAGLIETVLTLYPAEPTALRA